MYFIVCCCQPGLSIVSQFTEDEWAASTNHLIQNLLRTKSSKRTDEVTYRALGSRWSQKTLPSCHQTPPYIHKILQWCIKQKGILQQWTKHKRILQRCIKCKGILYWCKMKTSVYLTQKNIASNKHKCVQKVAKDDISMYFFVCVKGMV